MINVVDKDIMKASENGVIEKIGNTELMFQAGKSLYEAYDWKGKIAIICGSGNNAGDGYVLSGFLKNADVLRIEDKATKDGKYFLEKANNVSFINENTDLTKYDIIVDCIFGTGFNRKIEEPYKTIINKINLTNAKVISVDINSGLNTQNGLAEIAVKSDLTISIGYTKLGHYLNSAKDYIKELINNNIGIELIGKSYHLLEKEDVKKIFIDRKENSNKKTYGYTAIIGGCEEYSGAPKLSNLAYSALRSGCGIAKLYVPNSIKKAVEPYMLESILVNVEDQNGKMLFTNKFKELGNMDSIAIGMGLGESDEYKKIIEYILKNYNVPIIIDADGINTLAKMDLTLLKENVVLTPHLKEFSRLINKSIEEIKNNSVNLALEFTQKYHCTLLLKGPTTIITNGNETYLTNKGCSGMATAGSGDVLSGILAGLLAYSKENITYTTACGAYINGLAGEMGMEETNAISMLSRDTIINIPRAITEIRR